jgi:hypothetical protein
LAGEFAASRSSLFDSILWYEYRIEMSPIINNITYDRYMGTGSSAARGPALATEKGQRPRCARPGSRSCIHRRSRRITTSRKAAASIISIRKKRAHIAAERAMIEQRWETAMAADPSVNPVWFMAPLPFRLLSASSRSRLWAHIERCAAENLWQPQKGQRPF